MGTSGNDRAMRTIATRSAWDRRLTPLATAGRRFFSGGFGPGALLEQLERRQHGVGIPELSTVRLARREEPGTLEVWDASVESPAMVGPLPEAARTLHFRMRLPKGAALHAVPMAVVVELVPLLGAAPGLLLASRLGQLGVGSVELLAPGHGRRARTPEGRGEVDTVADFLLMQRAATLEACALAAWLLARGHPRVVLTGYGLGGALAAHAASVFPVPLATAPLLAPDCAAPVFLEGVLRGAVDLAALTREAGREDDARSRLERALGGVSVSAVESPRPAVLLAARADGWVPPASTLRLARALPGSPLRLLPDGHVTSALRQTARAAGTVLEALERMAPLELATSGD